ncbi:MAG: class II SORL domain-containing protein [Kiritimatiellae bacterium]|nr:class II SORL domain-containing protein [Kiritimatiellia bacterium]
MLSGFVKSADWKNEKHVPVIECGAFTPGEPLDVTVTVGKEIPHPNTAQHHISWIALHYVREGSQVSIELARCEFSAHAASMTDQPGPASTAPVLGVRVKLDAPGRLYATAYCNLHGLWASEKQL